VRLTKVGRETFRFVACVYLLLRCRLYDSSRVRILLFIIGGLAYIVFGLASFIA